MKLNYEMTADDFYAAWKTAVKTKDRLWKTACVSLGITVLLLSVSYYYAALFAVFAAVLIIFTEGRRKSKVKNAFETSVIARGKHTLRTYDDGLEVLGEYEKIFVPWQSVYLVKNTEKHLIILPTSRNGMVCISKERYGGAALDGIIGILAEKSGSGAHK